MSDWRKPVYAGGRLDLNFWTDVQASVVEVATGLKASPIPAFLLLMMCLVDATDFKIPGLSLAEEVAIIYISYGIIRRVWAKLNAENPTFTPSEFKAAEARMFGVSIIYGFGVLFLGLLLVVPAVMWGVRSSLGIVIAALEDSRSTECLKRSQTLVKGQYWRAFRYVFGGPMLIFLGILAIAIGGYTGVEMLPENSAKVAEYGLDFALSITFSYWQLALMPLLVRLYAYLKWEKEVVASDTVNKGFKPSEPRWETS